MSAAEDRRLSCLDEVPIRVDLRVHRQGDLCEMTVFLAVIIVLGLIVIIGSALALAGIFAIYSMGKYWGDMQ